MQRPFVVTSIVIALFAAGCAADDVAPAADPVGSDAPTTAAEPTTTTPAAPASPASSVPADPIVWQVAVTDAQIVDTSRDRRIPVRVRAPLGATGPAPVVLISHGGDGSERGYRTGAHIGDALAAAGFIAVHVGHRASSSGGQQLFDRPADVTAVLDAVLAGEIALPPGVSVIPDPDRVGHTGHSFGAYTSFAVGGATYLQDPDGTFRDTRIDAIAPISPQGPDQFGGFDEPDGSTWSSVTIPVFMPVGELELGDNALGTEYGPEWRLTPVRRIVDADAVAVVLAGQDHADMWSKGSATVKAFVAGEIVEFFSLTLRGDPVDPCGVGVGDLAGARIERSAAASGSSLLVECVDD
jgi:hypothetical protein